MQRTLMVSMGDRIPLRDGLHRNLVVVHGEQAVDAWLKSLPAVLARWCARWEITFSNDLPNSAHNVMVFGESARAGSVVLKLNLPCHEIRSELEAIGQTSGDGMVRLVDADPDIAIMMLERVVPGTPLRTADLSDDAATVVGAEVMRRFWQSRQREDNLFGLRDWVGSLLDYPMRPTYPDGPIPARLIDRAIETAKCLLDTQTDLVLLHGDIHHDNILWGGERGWITIDPKGLVGERGFDIGTWMHNPPGYGLQLNLGVLLRKRIMIFAEQLKLDPYRVAQWSYMFLVLSMCWTTESEGHDDFTSTMNCAIEMERIMDELNT